MARSLLAMAAQNMACEVMSVLMMLKMAIWHGDFIRFQTIPKMGSNLKPWKWRRKLGQVNGGPLAEVAPYGIQWLTTLNLTYFTLVSAMAPLGINQ